MGKIFKDNQFQIMKEYMEYMTYNLFYEKYVYITGSSIKKTVIINKHVFFTCKSINSEFPKNNGFGRKCL